MLLWHQTVLKSKCQTPRIRIILKKTKKTIVVKISSTATWTLTTLENYAVVSVQSIRPPLILHHSSPIFFSTAFLVCITARVMRKVQAQSINSTWPSSVSNILSSISLLDKKERKTKCSKSWKDWHTYWSILPPRKQQTIYRHGIKWVFNHYVWLTHWTFAEHLSCNTDCKGCCCRYFRIRPQKPHYQSTFPYVR